MEANLLKTLFDNGGLKGARIEPFPMEDEAWLLNVELGNGGRTPVFRVRTKRPKVYKSVHAALLDVKKIGFKTAEVCL